MKDDYNYQLDEPQNCCWEGCDGARLWRKRYCEKHQDMLDDYEWVKAKEHYYNQKYGGAE